MSVLAASIRAELGGLLAGTARVDITPTEPVLMAGYAGRAEPTAEVDMPLFGRALALGEDGGRTRLIIAVEVCGIPAEFADRVATGIAESHGLGRDEIAVLVTHTHTGPAVAGYLPCQARQAPNEDEVEAIATYTRQLEAKLIQIGRDAIDSRRPSVVTWSQGSSSMARNRRVIENGRWVKFGDQPGGPVDHRLPLLVCRDAENGSVQAMFTSYANHCTSAGGGDHFHPDWAGELASQLENGFEGAVALVGIGCAGDANAMDRGTPAAARRNAELLHTEIERLLDQPGYPVPAPTRSAFRRIGLPFERVPDVEELAEIRVGAKKHQKRRMAERLLSRLETGDPLPTAMPMSLQVWEFGDDLVMILLGNEMVADYALRLRREFDPDRLWVAAYANGIAGYVASKRMMPEGGYEVDQSMASYGWASPLRTEVEQLIVDQLHAMTADDFNIHDH